MSQVDEPENNYFTTRSDFYETKNVIMVLITIVMKRFNGNEEMTFISYANLIFNFAADNECPLYNAKID